MRLARRLTPTHDTVFSLCISAAIAIVCLALASSCVRPLPDLGKIPRGQYSRIVRSGAQTCQAWLPLVVRASAGQEFVALALEAAQPWAASTGLAIAVPAVGDEPSNVDVILRPCPDGKASDSFPYCVVTAQTAGACDGATYRQVITIFFAGSSATVVATLIHELGHALGADGGDHNASPRSIMYKTTPLSVSEAHPLAQSVTPEDAASVRAAWGAR